MAGADLPTLARRDPVLRELRKLNPKALRATYEGKEKALSWRPDVGNKWERLSKLLDAIQWDYIEALDEKGAVLGRVEPSADEPSEDDEDEDYESGWSPKEVAREMREAFREQQKEARLTFESQLAGYAAQTEHVGNVLTVMTEGIRMLVETFNTAMKVQSASQAANAMGDDGNAEVKAMLGTALQMMLMSKSPTVAP